MTAETNEGSSRPRRNLLFRNLELVIAVLLGFVSIATAYASFQAALYDSQMAGAYTKGSNLATEAESLYLEGNQQFIQDAQLWNRLSELTIESNSADVDFAAAAAAKIDTLTFMSVSEEFGAAIAFADEQNAADPEFYYSPLDDEDYQDFLYSGWADTKEEATALVADGDEYNSLSDRLTLNTVLMSISLFLLGISALVRQFRVQIILMGTAIVIFVSAVALTVAIPFIGL